ncbi:MAG: acetylornithine/succinyldiaminopimelate transaminase [Gammaproteobacteria bacterium]
MVSRKEFTKYFLPVYNPGDFIPIKGKGSFVWDQKNNKYLDFASGIAVSALGHCHPKLVKILINQSKKLWHLSNYLTSEPAVNLAKILCQKSFAEKVFLSNSGAEAVEAAIKTARKFSYSEFGKSKSNIVAFDDAFHGRTLLTIALNGSKRMTEGFGPLPKGITQHPFNQIEGLEKCINDKTAAVILELVQGEAGIIPAKQEFVNSVRKLCKKHNALIIIDEVQSGVGRTGYLFAHEKYKIVPDIVCLAKALGNGLPIGAMLTSEKVGKYMQPGAHGSTYGGNPLASAVACEVINEISKKSLLNGVKRKEERLLKGLYQINAELDCFEEIRSAGLWIGCKLKVQGNLNLDNLIKSAYSHRLMILKANNNTVRIAPSLIIENQVIDEGLARLKKSIQKLLG